MYAEFHTIDLHLEYTNFRRQAVIGIGYCLAFTSTIIGLYLVLLKHYLDNAAL
jgi:hypothetical protein